jgi:hypothetical protein
VHLVMKKLCSYCRRPTQDNATFCERCMASSRTNHSERSAAGPFLRTLAMIVDFSILGLSTFGLGHLILLLVGLNINDGLASRLIFYVEHVLPYVPLRPDVRSALSDFLLQWPYEIALLFLGVLVGMLYYPIFESSQVRATVGKIAVGVLVRPSEQKRLTLFFSFLRSALKFSFIIPFGVALFGPVALERMGYLSKWVILAWPRFSMFLIGLSLLLLAIQLFCFVFTSSHRGPNDYLSGAYIERRENISQKLVYAGCIASIALLAVTGFTLVKVRQTPAVHQHSA